MSKVQLRFIKSYNWFITGLLTLLGYSCTFGPHEYGTPSAKFIVNGRVTSASTEQPIEDIRVIIPGDTSYTNSNGEYQVSNRGAFPQEQTFDIRFEDTDGNLHGKFIDLDTAVEFKNPQFTGGDGDWYEGETSTDFDVKLTPDE